MTVAVHIVATTRGRDRSLLEPQKASWLWQHLVLGVPGVLSFALMPDHLHAMWRLGCLARIRRVLTGFTHAFGVRFDVRIASEATTPKIAGRMMRYGFFNPVRAGWVDDPLEWPWSTLRDLVGAAHPIATPIEETAEVLRLPASAALRGLGSLGAHRFEAPSGQAVQVASDHELRRAVAHALRTSESKVLEIRSDRRLLAQLAVSTTRPARPTDLARILKVSPRNARRLLTPLHPGLSAARVCLADPRLRLPFPDAGVLRRAG